MRRAGNDAPSHDARLPGSLQFFTTFGLSGLERGGLEDCARYDPGVSATHPHLVPQLVLASRSPRRRALLESAGLGAGDPCQLTVVDPPYDDPGTPNPRAGESAGRFAASTALQKARSVMNEWSSDLAVILAADTVCVAADGTLLGKPADRSELLDMLRGFVNATHDVVTGVALLQRDADGHLTHEEHWHDTAAVAWGVLDDTALLAYADTAPEGLHRWQDKAGGYNLEERVAAGWPITVDGDPATVVGLPMLRLIPALAALGVAVPQTSNRP